MKATENLRAEVLEWIALWESEHGKSIPKDWERRLFEADETWRRARDGYRALIRDITTV